MAFISDNDLYMSSTAFFVFLFDSLWACVAFVFCFVLVCCLFVSLRWHLD